eukprot:758412_1
MESSDTLTYEFELVSLIVSCIGFLWFTQILRLICVHILLKQTTPLHLIHHMQKPLLRYCAFYWFSILIARLVDVVFTSNIILKFSSHLDDGHSIRCAISGRLLFIMELIQA